MQQPDRITIDEVMRRINRGEKLVFVDVRDRDAWSESEALIGGATRVPPDEIEKHAARLPKNPLVVYCSSPNEQTSMQVARELLGRGWREVRPLAGGFDAWQRARGFVAAKPKGGDVHRELRTHAPVAVSRTPSPQAEGAPSQAGAGAGAPATPMSPMPSDHRRRPDEVPVDREALVQGSDRDIKPRVQLEPKPRESEHRVSRHSVS
ncbi:MAG: hypothetical protein HYV09_23595 [Deltaproteobacteria bacterium]|nr:hypothetical protein [Deltaproteobacteria bacterium]